MFLLLISVYQCQWLKNKQFISFRCYFRKYLSNVIFRQAAKIRLLKKGMLNTSSLKIKPKRNSMIKRKFNSKNKYDDEKQDLNESNNFTDLFYQ